MCTSDSGTLGWLDLKPIASGLIIKHHNNWTLWNVARFKDSKTFGIDSRDVGYTLTDLLHIDYTHTLHTANI